MGFQGSAPLVAKKRERISSLFNCGEPWQRLLIHSSTFIEANGDGCSAVLSLCGSSKKGQKENAVITVGGLMSYSDFHNFDEIEELAKDIYKTVLADLQITQDTAEAYASACFELAKIFIAEANKQRVEFVKTKNE